MDVFPIVNLNGTDVIDLIAQQLRVQRAAKILAEAMSRAAPHGRDYPGVTGTDDAPTRIAAARDRWEADAIAVAAIKGLAERTMADLIRQGRERHSEGFMAMLVKIRDEP